MQRAIQDLEDEKRISIGAVLVARIILWQPIGGKAARHRVVASAFPQRNLRQPFVIGQGQYTQRFVLRLGVATRTGG